MGYEYINTGTGQGLCIIVMIDGADDGWLNLKRDGNNRQVPGDNFNKGMTDVSDYIHSKGLKFG